MPHLVRPRIVALLTLFALWPCLVMGQPADAPPPVDGPGRGRPVQPVVGPVLEEMFQTLLVARALEALGYAVAPPVSVTYAEAHGRVGRGEGTYFAAHWEPLAEAMYAAAGGRETLSRRGIYVPESLQGYLIDARTARAHRIERIDQLKDPAIARLFDTDGDGRANLVGCPPGWNCATVIDHQLAAYGLTGQVTHDQGDYDAAMAAVVRRKRSGKPVLYYGWVPHWVGAELRPGADVIWLEVPFSALPGERAEVDTVLLSGHNFGFELNNQRIVANKAWVADNPAAGRLFEVMTLPIEDVSAQNKRLHKGERSPEAIAGHVDAWIAAHRETFDGWLLKARAGAVKPHP